jgi:hypothetical protein
MFSFKRDWPVVLLLLEFIILRIPSLFEPHWYGDEGIYASVAFAIEHGKKLYVDVFDNRLPGIYYIYSLATSENRQFVMRLLSLFAGIITILGIGAIGKTLKLKGVATVIAIAIATFMLGTPFLEGNTANNEHFFLPLTIWGIWFILQPNFKSKLFAGILFGLSFIVKFPPVFTMCAGGLYLILLASNSFLQRVKNSILLGIGFVIPIAVGSFLLFINGNFFQAIQFGILNNKKYVEYYSTEGFTLEQKTIGLAVIIAVISFIYWRKWISHVLFLFLSLLVVDTYAAMFSGRQYTHYLLQVIPAVSLLGGYAVHFMLEKKTKLIFKPVGVIVFYLGWHFILYLFAQGVGTGMHIKPEDYYKDFRLASKYIFQRDYPNNVPEGFFQESKKIIAARKATESYKTKQFYFFTNESWVYDYVGIVPPTMFITEYHQYMVDKGVKRNVSDLQKSAPKIVGFDKDLKPPDELKSYVEENYTKDKEDAYYVYFVKK